MYLLVFFVMPAYADLASTSYVDTHIEDKVGTSSTTNQTMAGTYTVSGTFNVPTPPLPAEPAAIVQ